MQLSAFHLALAETWAIRGEEDLRQILEIAAREHELDMEAVEAKRGQHLENALEARLRDGVATIPIVGPIFRYANLFTRISGATAIESTARDLQTAADSAQVRAIMLPIDSPGGTVNGTNELAKLVRQVDERKPVVAYVSAAGASGAYWIASAARQVFADETAQLGSIGVLAAYLDDRARRERSGVREVTFVSSQSPRKRPDPDTDEGRAQIQQRVDALAQVFIESVARNRGVSPDTVMSDFGRGDVLVGKGAVNAGMADGIATHEEVLAGLAAGNIAGPRDMGRRSSITVNKEEPTMTDQITAAGIAEKHPEVAKALRAEGRAEGEAAGREAGLKDGEARGRAAGLAEGAKAERERIASLKAASLPGFEAELEAAIADGKSTAAELALAQQAKLKGQSAEALAKIKADEAALKGAAATAAGTLPAPAASATGQGGAVATEPADGEAAAKAADEKTWAKDAQLRAEFGGKKDAYLAFQRGQRAERIKGGPREVRGGRAA